MGSFLDSLSGALGTLSGWLSSAWRWLANMLPNLLDWAKAALKFIWNTLKAAVRSIGHAISDLAHGRWGALWADLKGWYAAFIKWTNRLYKMLLGPIVQWHRQITMLYNKYFRPVVQFFDALRRIVQIIGIFDRKLAAQIDQYLWKIEATILTPITYLNSRVNSISSYIRALVTTLGFLDQPLLLESVRRNAAIMWKVMVNPLGKPAPAVIPPPPFPDTAYLSTLDGNWTQWRSSNTGPLADTISSADDYWSQVRTELN